MWAITEFPCPHFCTHPFMITLCLFCSASLLIFFVSLAASHLSPFPEPPQCPGALGIQLNAVMWTRLRATFVHFCINMPRTGMRLLAAPMLTGSLQDNNLQ